MSGQYSADDLKPYIDTPSFERAMAESPVVSIKLNRRKCKDISELGYEGLMPVEWCGSGYYLEQRPVFTLNPLLHAGIFYVQDASSMIYETIVAKLIEKGLLPVNPVVLDMCAAPGGKTTSMINALPDTATVVANEVVPKRYRILEENLLKWGFPNTVVTNLQASEIAKKGAIFDLIAVDAPCSGEGMMRKDQDAVDQWSPALVAQCAALQRDILSNVLDVLRPGGMLIYSTCTFNRTENEEQLKWLVEEFGLEPIDMSLPEEWGIGSQFDSPYPALRFMPHITRGEGLFAAVLRKPDSAPDTFRASFNKKHFLKEDKRIIKSKSAKIESPDPFLPFSVNYVSGSYPEVELSLESALSYLRHEAIHLPGDIPKGYVVVKYKGHPLGFVKNIGSRANNLFPKEWRIRNL